ncbi:MAG: hemerythrin family protein [Magnetospirillum sp.]|nr:hemerythrin family protein [Magnetospirillum sp.]
MPMPWLSGMNLGMAGFDADHRHLVEVLAELRTNTLQGNASGVRALFDEFRAATLEHLDEEEALMARLDYPAAAEHVADHQRTRFALLGLGRIVAAGRMDSLMDALDQYSTAYLRGMLRHDGMLARFLREAGSDVVALAAFGHGRNSHSPA